jgi:hypothetical protein
MKLDWVHLPPGREPISLWDSLHDGELASLRSDLFRRSLTMECRVWHLINFHKLPESLSFTFELSNVTSARVTRWARWPGEVAELKGLSHEEQTRIVAEYQAKWREESDSWQSFEDQITTGQIDAPDIHNAQLALDNKAVALSMDIDTEDQGFRALTIAAESLTIRRSDGNLVTLQAFLQLGEEYWSAFASRRSGEL